MTGDDSIVDAAPPPFVRLAGGLVFFAGVIAILTGGQVLALMTVSGPIAPLPYALVAVGVAECYFGVAVFRARSWGAIGAVAVSALLTLATGAWLVIAAMNGLYQLNALTAPFAAALALGLSIASVRPCERATAARAALARAGIDLGI